MLKVLSSFFDERSCSKQCLLSEIIELNKIIPVLLLLLLNMILNIEYHNDSHTTHCNQVYLKAFTDYRLHDALHTWQNGLLFIKYKPTSCLNTI